MSERISRPPSVYIAQALLIIFALVFSSIFLINLISLLKNLSGGFSVIRAIISYTVMLGIILLFLSSFWGMAKRKMYGRRLGLVSLVFLWGLILFINLYRPPGPHRYYEYENNAQLIGAVIFQIIFNGIFLVLILHLTFAKSVRAFFSSGIAGATTLSK